MGLVFRILLLFVVVFLDRGNCGVFVKTIRQRRALLPNVTSSRPTTFNHVYNIKLPHCKSCSPNISKPLAHIFEAQDEARDDKRFEHDVDPTNQVVFTHRINIPPQVCGCDDVQALLSRLESLEKLVATLRRQCSSNTCCGAKNTIDCGAHGTFSSSTCGCVCEEGWSGPTCAKANCPANCHPPQGDCVAGRCVCREGFTGEDCSQEICPDDCNDQGRCIDEKCVCFPGYTGYGCTEEICPDDCRGRGRCVDGRCVCNKGYSGFDCGVEDCPGGCNGQGRCVEGKCICNAGFSGKDCGLRDCPANCHGQGDCVKGKCVCKKGFTGPDCGVKACPQNCNDRGRCVNGKCVCNTGYSGPSCSIQACPDNCNKQGKCVNGKCVCNTGYSGPSCSIQACPDNCNKQGKCVNGKCVCNTGYSGPKCSVQDCPNNCNKQGHCTDGKCVCKDGFTGNDCAIEIPAPIGLQVKKILETKATVEWELPRVPVDAWEITFKPLKEDNDKLTKRLAGSKSSFQQTGLASGQEYQVTLRAQKGKKFGPAVSKTLRTLIDGPRNLHVVAATNSTIKLGWKKPQASIDLYRLNYSSATGKHSQVVVPAGDISAVLTGLEAGVEHNIFLVGEQGGHQSKAATTKGTTVIDSPRNLRVVTVTDSTISLEWEKSIARVGQYHIAYRTEAGKGGELRVPGKGNTATLVGLEDHTKYTISLVAEQGNMKSMPVTTVGTTGLTQRKLAGSHSAPTVAANENQFIQHISKAISRKIAAAELSADVSTTAQSVIRRYPAFAKNLLGSPKVQLVILPTRDQINSERGQGAKKSKGGHGPVRKRQEVTLVRPGRPMGPGRKVTGSPGIPPALKHRKGPVGSPSSNGTRETSLNARRTGKGSESRQHTSEPTKQEILGGKDKTGNSGSSRLTSRIHLPPVGNLREPAVSRTSVTGSKESANPLALNITSSHIVLSWDIAEGLFDTLLLSYRDPSTNAVLSEMVLGGDQRMANITGLTIGKSYKVSLHGISGSNPSQPIHITGVAVSGPGEGPAGAQTDSTALQTVETQGKGSEVEEEEEDDDDEEDEEEKEEAEEGGQEELELSAPLNAELENAALSNVASENLTQGWVPTVFNHSLVSTQNTTVSNAPQTQETGDLSGLTPNATHQAVTDDKLSAPLADQGANFNPLSTSNLTANSLRLSWIVDRAFDSFLIQYRVPGSEETHNITVTGGRRSHLIVGLKPTTRYTVYIYGIFNGKRTKPLTTTVTTTDKEAQRPTSVVVLDNVSVSKVTAHSLELSWKVERTYDSFLIEYGLEGSEDVRNLTVTGDRRSTVITGLRPTTAYRLYLYGVSGGQRTKPLTTSANTSDAVKPIKLGALSVSEVTAHSVRISWTTQLVFSSFLIQYRAQGSQSVRNLTVTAHRRSYLITGLRPNTKYTIYVYGISRGQHSAPSTVVITTREAQRPTSVVVLDNVSVSKVTAHSLKLSWKTERTYDSFLIEYGIEGSEDVRNLTVTGERRSTIITGLRPTTAYRLYLYGVSGGQLTKLLTTSANTSVSTDKEAQKPTSVVVLDNVSVSKVTAHSLKLSWKTERAYDSFLIEYGIEGSEDVRNLTVTGDRRSTVITGLRPTTAYRLYLYGVSGGQLTKLLTTSANTSVSTDKEAQKPTSVVVLDNVSVSKVTAHSLKLSWKTERAYDSFLIEYGIEGSEDVRNLTVTGDRRSTVITGLRPTTAYRLYLYGVSGGQLTKLLTTSANTSVSTDKEAQRPTSVVVLDNVSVSKVTAHSLEFSWKTERTYDSFLIKYGIEGSENVRNLTVTGDRQSTVITGLRPTTAYRLYLYGVSGGQRTKLLTTSANTSVSTDKEAQRPTSVVVLDNVSVSKVTAHSLELSWKTGRTYDSFLIEYGLEGSENVRNLTVTGDRRFTVITGLRPTTVYRLYLYGVSGGQRTKLLTTSANTSVKDTVKPSKLGDTSVSHITTQSFKLSWMASKGFDSFLIQYSSAAEPRRVHNLTVAGDQRSSFVKGLRPTTVYTVHLYGVTKGQRTKPLTSIVTTAASTGAIVTEPSQTVELGGLSALPLTPHSVRLSWFTKRDFDSYAVQYRAQGSEEVQKLSLSGHSRSHTITGLRPTTKYTFYLYGVSSGRHTTPLSTAATTKGTPVRALGSLSVSNITADSVELSWSTQWPFDSYVIQFRAQGSEEVQKLRVTGNRRSYILLGLKPTTKYTIYVYGVAGGRHTSPLSIVVTTTVSIDTNGVKPSRLSKLIRLSGNNVTQDSLQIFWAAESGFDSFLIQYRVEGSKEVRNFTVPAHRHSSFIEGLRPSTKYLISLYGISGSKRTRPLTTIITTAASADKEEAKSGKFGSLSFSNITADSLLLSWTAETVFDSFLIQYKSQGSETLQNITVTGDRRSTYITGLRPTTNYTIYLYGVSGGQFSRPLVALLTITAIPIHTVGFSTLGRLSVSDVDTHSLKLTWTVEEGAFDSFLVQYRDSQGRLGAKEVTVPGNLRHVAITDLIPGTEYLISLYGVLKNQQTEPIPIVARTAREIRSRLRFTDLRDTSVTVHWAVPSTPVDTFKIFYVPTKQGEPKSVIIDGGKTNITLKGLVPDTQYEVNLVAIQGAVESSPVLDHFTTAPDAPAALKAVNVSETVALLTWRPAITPVNHYIITYSGPTVATVSRNVAGNSAALQLTGLSVNTQYTAEIYSVKGDRKSSRISTSFVTDSDLPRDLTARDISLTEALLSWKSPRGPVTGYLLVYGTEGGETEQVKLDPTVTSHRLRQLLPSTRYTVKLHALRDGERTAAITAYFTTVSAHIPFPKDCGEEHSNGRRDSSIVTLYLDRNKDKPFKVYCDMTTNGGGWMVFQRRMNGKINFMRNWKDYSTGFGALTGEHWLGLQYLHQLTSQQRYELRVDLRDGNKSAYAIYDNFAVESLDQRYRLTVGKYSGNAGDSLSYHHGSNFTTLDSDNDEALTNCAMSYRGGWWYKNCHRVNLNGEYGNNRDHQGVNWFGWKGFELSIPFTEMKMRPYKFAREAVRKA
ncbi:tenascin-like [Mustelus asterias]